MQERLDLTAEIAAMGTAVDITALEAEFVKVAKSYSERRASRTPRGVTVGVDAVGAQARRHQPRA